VGEWDARELAEGYWPQVPDPEQDAIAQAERDAADRDAGEQAELDRHGYGGFPGDSRFPT
jgi:hypothetical protein